MPCTKFAPLQLLQEVANKLRKSQCRYYYRMHIISLQEMLHCTRVVLVSACIPRTFSQHDFRGIEKSMFATQGQNPYSLDVHRACTAGIVNTGSFAVIRLPAVLNA